MLPEQPGCLSNFPKIKTHRNQDLQESRAYRNQDYDGKTRAGD
jgi:hypothetical protein